MNKLLALIICFCCAHTCLAQATVEMKGNIIGDIYEKYTATLDSNKVETRTGTYTCYRGKKIIAGGQYTNGKRSGIWHFNNRDGKEMQRFDYDNNKLLFEAPEPALSSFQYVLDYPITAKDKVTQPIKLGGRYFGYLTYVKKLRKIHDLRGLDEDNYGAVLNLLVSPMGRLADCTVVLLYKPTGQSSTYVVNTDDLPESERMFVPATYNGQAVTSRIQILCKPDDDGEINLPQGK